MLPSYMLDARAAPILITAKDGLVHASDPGLAAVRMTPQAAIDTGIRLIEAAAEAEGQQAITASRARWTNAPLRSVTTLRSNELPARKP